MNLNFLRPILYNLCNYKELIFSYSGWVTICLLRKIHLFGNLRNLVVDDSFVCWEKFNLVKT